jgi:NAD(P)H dehydrogenase (quinone)
VVNIAVIYYSSTGHVHQLAEAAGETGAEVRLRRAAELASEEVIRWQDAWHKHYLATKDAVAEASLEVGAARYQGRRLAELTARLAVAPLAA